MLSRATLEPARGIHALRSRWPHAAKRKFPERRRVNERSTSRVSKCRTICVPLLRLSARRRDFLLSLRAARQQRRRVFAHRAHDEEHKADCPCTITR
jgi:hypothetical protein